MIDFDLFEPDGDPVDGEIEELENDDGGMIDFRLEAPEVSGNLLEDHRIAAILQPPVA